MLGIAFLIGQVVVGGRECVGADVQVGFDHKVAAVIVSAQGIDLGGPIDDAVIKQRPGVRRGLGVL